MVTEKYKLPGGEEKTRKYKIGSELGKGGFATCYEMTNLETNQKYACKLVIKSSLGRSHSK